MNSIYRNDRNAFGGQNSGSEPSAESKDLSRMNKGQSWNRLTNEDANPTYGRDNASMRGNDYYGTQGFINDYSRGNYSDSTFSAGARNIHNKDPRQSAGESNAAYEEFPDYSNRPTYGSYAASRAYTNFMSHNYGYSGMTGGQHTAGLDLGNADFGHSRRDHNAYGMKDASGKRLRYRSSNQSRYSENDGRRR